MGREWHFQHLFLANIFTEMGQQMGPGLREHALAARGSQEAGSRNLEVASLSNTCLKYRIFFSHPLKSLIHQAMLGKYTEQSYLITSRLCSFCIGRFVIVFGAVPDFHRLCFR